jgi:hypothetical protein
MKLIAKTPSKFSSGISILWRGCDFATLNAVMLKSIKPGNHKNLFDENIEGFPFSSGRAAIKTALEALGIGKGDNVVVSAFTCDAVTHAVMSSGAKIIYVDINDDLTMSESCIDEAIDTSTRVLIVQNTFGRLGVSESYLSKIKEKGLIIIEDNCLSSGSNINGRDLGSFGDVSVWSLEVSKTATIGWGGILKVNNSKYLSDIWNYYSQLKSTSLLADAGRIAQTWITLFFIKHKPLGGWLAWYAFYGMGVFRRSSSDNKILLKNRIKMGYFSKIIYKGLIPYLEEVYSKTAFNYLEFEKFTASLDIKMVPKSKVGEFIVSPRFSILIKEGSEIEVEKIANDWQLEIGRWFKECPPKFRIDDCRIHSYKNAEKLSKKIINIPAYWTLSLREKKIIKMFIKNLREENLLQLE